MSNRRAALITGGGTGIGAATAEALRSEGWDVVICGRRLDPLLKVAEATGAIPLVADATSTEGVNQIVEAAIEQFGTLNGLVLNAGVVHPGPVGELGDDEWDVMVGTNLSGPFRLLRAAMPHLLASRGAVVGVASAAALRSAGDAPGYSATKAGLTMLLQSTGVHYGPRGLRANVVCPGWTRTEMADLTMQEFGPRIGMDFQQAYDVATSFVPARRPATAAEVAQAVCWLLSDQASYVNAAVLPVDGGMVAVDPGYLPLDPRVSLQEV